MQLKFGRGTGMLGPGFHQGCRYGGGGCGGGGGGAFQCTDVGHGWAGPS